MRVAFEKYNVCCVNVRCTVYDMRECVADMEDRCVDFNECYGDGVIGYC